MQRSLLLLTATLALTGFAVVSSFTTAQARQQAEDPRSQELAKVIGERSALVDDLDAALEQLRAEVSTAQRTATRRTSAAEATTSEMEALALQAGTVAVAGRGIAVHLDNSDRIPQEAKDVGAYRIHDTDLQLVVNALFASGAEAVAVNDSRVVATTAIRAAGDTIVVNFRPLSPPFEVVAIGASQKAFDATEIAARFRRWNRVFGLGYEVRAGSDLRAPAYNGRVRISTASPAAA